MKKIVSLLFLTVLVVNLPAHAQEKADKAADPKVLAATAADVAKDIPLEKQFTEMTDAISETLPPAKRPLFVSIMKKNIDIPALRVAAQQALIKTYTLDELKSMKDHTQQPGSPEMLDKMNKFTADMQPTIDAMVGKAVAQAKKAGIVPEKQATQ